MMKTLKDFYKIENALFSDFGEKKKGFSIDSEELKKEAIKWIKEDIKDILENQDKIVVISKGTRFMDFPEIKRWIERFNIKKEELL